MSEQTVNEAANAIQDAELFSLRDLVGRLKERMDVLDAAYGKIGQLEHECRRLRSALGAKSTGQPMDIGHTFYPPGDPIPSRGGPNEHLVDYVYTHSVDKRLVVTILLKNTTGGKLKPGESIEQGVVDTRLAHDVEPNDYFYCEI